MLIVQYKNDKWASAQREFNNPRICFWAAKREKLITRKYQRLVVVSSWNRDLMLRLERPLSHYWTSPLNIFYIIMSSLQILVKKGISQGLE